MEDSNQSPEKVGIAFRASVAQSTSIGMFLVRRVTVHCSSSVMYRKLERKEQGTGWQPCLSLRAASCPIAQNGTVMSSEVKEVKERNEGA